MQSYQRGHHLRCIAPET